MTVLLHTGECCSAGTTESASTRESGCCTSSHILHTCNNYVPDIDNCHLKASVHTSTLCHSYLAWRAPPSPGRWPVWWPLPGSSWASSWAWAAPRCRWSCSRCQWGTGDPWSKHRCSFSTRCIAADTDFILFIQSLSNQDVPWDSLSILQERPSQNGSVGQITRAATISRLTDSLIHQKLIGNYFDNQLII